MNDNIMNTKKELDEDWADTMATLESLRSVIVKQRKKWRRMMAENLEVDNVKKLHKESEVLEHMINRIENGLNKSRCSFQRASLRYESDIYHVIVKLLRFIEENE